MKRWRRTVVVAAVVLLVCMVGWLAYPHLLKAYHYQAGLMQAQRGELAQAIQHFARVAVQAPEYRNLPEYLDVIYRQVNDTLPGGSDIETEVALLRWLDAAQDIDRLIEMLDHSRVTVPAGDFRMGSDDGHRHEGPLHTVYLDSFAISRYEVTNAQYQRFVVETGNRVPPYWMETTYPAGKDAYPVVGISWWDADAYCNWAGGRLPTEAEWERTCRGDDGHVYPWGDTWEPERANVDRYPGSFYPAEAAETRTDIAPDLVWPLLQELEPAANRPVLLPVGSYQDGVSLYGTLDMVGNAAEWVADWYNWDDYTDIPAENPLILSPEWNHSLRGSGWYEPYGTADWVQFRSRCSMRGSAHAPHDPRIGVRCAFMPDA